MLRLSLACCFLKGSRKREGLSLQHLIENYCLTLNISFMPARLDLVSGPMQNSFGQAQGKTIIQQPLGMRRAHKDLKQEQVSPKPSLFLLFQATQGCLKVPKCRYDRLH